MSEQNPSQSSVPGAVGEPRTEAGRRFVANWVYIAVAADPSHLIRAIEKEASGGAVGEHESDCRNKGIKVRCDDCGVLLSAGGAVGEREEPLDRLDDLAWLIAYHEFEATEEWGAWGSLLDRLMSIHGRPGDGSRREAAAMLRHLIGLARLSVNEGGVAGAESRESDR